jgi:hypothetical protein
MMDKVGKVLIAQGSQRRCVICDGIYSREASRMHSVETCFLVPSACPPIPDGVTAGTA